MHTFIVLSLVAVACAQYDYQQGVGNGGGLNGIGSTVGNDLGSGLGGHVSSADIGGASNGGFGNGLGGSFNAGDRESSDSDSKTASPTFNTVSSSAPQDAYPADSNDAISVAPPAGVQRHFYTYTADENDFNDDNAYRSAESVRQAVRVVIIKGPENKGLEDAALSLANNAGQKTAIYVLNREADISDLANKLNALNNNKSNRPDVHFVKYRTAEDATNAQKAIQGQYDALAGNSKSIDGGIATFLDFGSQASAAAAPVIAAPSNTNLPPNGFRMFRH